MVNGVDQSTLVDQVFQAMTAPAGRIPDTQTELSEADEQAILDGHAVYNHTSGPRNKGKKNGNTLTPQLLPPECIGAACQARADLATFAAACAADRNCAKIAGIKQAGQEHLAGQVPPST